MRKFWKCLSYNLDFLRFFSTSKHFLKFRCKSVKHQIDKSDILLLDACRINYMLFTK